MPVMTMTAASQVSRAQKVSLVGSTQVRAFTGADRVPYGVALHAANPGAELRVYVPSEKERHVLKL